MAKHLVKCLYCKEVFDAKPEDMDIVWCKPRVNRYAHVECMEKEREGMEQDEKDFDELYRYVSKEQGSNFNFVQFKKVTDSWKKDYNYTYSGMLKSLLYFYEVKKNSKEKLKAGSIGIIPFCYTQAYNYYYDIYMAAQAAKNADFKGYTYTEISIDAPQKKVLPPKLFNLDMENNNEE